MSKYSVSVIFARSVELDEKENEIKVLLRLIFGALERECKGENKSSIRSNYKRVFSERITDEFVIWEHLAYRWAFCNFDGEIPQEIRFYMNTGWTALQADNTGTVRMSVNDVDIIHSTLQVLLDALLEKFPWMERRLHVFLNPSKTSSWR